MNGFISFFLLVVLAADYLTHIYSIITGYTHPQDKRIERERNVCTLLTFTGRNKTIVDHQLQTNVQYLLKILH